MFLHTQRILLIFSKNLLETFCNLVQFSRVIQYKNNDHLWYRLCWKDCKFLELNGKQSEKGLSPVSRCWLHEVPGIMQECRSIYRNCIVIACDGGPDPRSRSRTCVYIFFAIKSHDQSRNSGTRYHQFFVLYNTRGNHDKQYFCWRFSFTFFCVRRTHELKIINWI